MEKLMRWEAHYPEEIPFTIEYDNISLYSFLKEAATRFGEKKALHFMGKELTYFEVYNEAKKVANYLQGLGLKKGDRVAIMLPNCPQTV
ncbi:MAG TPA: AMP-binding protein, partial [Pseudogracilibacillus sp.]|nr:AMP-binding protein [Pseudogracilibacillus sp.]